MTILISFHLSECLPLYLLYREGFVKIMKLCRRNSEYGTKRAINVYLPTMEIVIILCVCILQYNGSSAWRERHDDDDVEEDFENETGSFRAKKFLQNYHISI